jgi:hypothetical protein
MKKYLIAGALVVAFAAPALAADYYVALRLGGGAAACEVMTTEPNTKTHKMMGKYSSEAAAKAAMATMKECGG